MSMIQSPHQPVKQTPQSMKQKFSELQSLQMNQAVMLGSVHKTQGFNSH